MKPIFKKVVIVIVGIFACIGMTFTVVFVGMQFGIFNVRGSIGERNKFFTDSLSSATTTFQYDLTLDVPCVNASKKVCLWNETPEWMVIKSALQKDEAVILRVSQETGVSKRMIAAVVIPEQSRFFTSNREVFKRYFEPMKILGSMSQFSLGVSGIKIETAQDIEKNMGDEHSVFYPGSNMTKLVRYASSTDPEKELYYRLTDAKDHYYSYLYTALFIKEIQAQWKREGYDITQKPEVVVTLFNIGFDKSKPNTSPVAGGSEIVLGGQTYLYGQLGTNFYHSEELVDIFPR
jgi:hypothetical protein